MSPKLIPFTISISLATVLFGCKKSEEAVQSTPDVKTPVSSPKDSGSAPSVTAGSPAAKGSEGGVVLQVKWPVGNRYVYRMDLDQHNTTKIPQMPTPMQQDVTMAMTYALSVVQENAAGGRDLDIEFLANEMDVQMGGQTMISFDSKETSKNDAQNPFSAPYRKMIGTKIRLELKADGTVDKIVGFQEWSDKVTADTPEPGKGMFAQQFNEGYLRQITEFARALPAKPVQAGDSWPFNIDVPIGPMGTLQVKSTITLKGWEDHDQHKTAILNSKGTMKGGGKPEAGPMGKMSIDNGTATGTSWFDPELGALIESQADQTMVVKGELPGAPGGGQPGGGFHSDVKQKVIIKLVELGKTK